MKSKNFIFRCLFFFLPAVIFTIMSAAGAARDDTSEATISMEEVGIEETIRDSVPQPPGSSVYFDKRTGNLIVTNSADNLAATEELIASMDIIPFQVEIETKFIDIDTEKVAGLGIDWTSIGANPGFTSGHSRVDVDIELPLVDRTTDKFFSALRAYTGQGLTLAFSRLKEMEFGAVLAAIERTGDANILSAPRVTTLNHREASIELVNEAVFQEWKEDQEYETAMWQNVVGLTTSTYEREIPTDFVMDNWGVYLTVNPHIGADMNTVTLDLKPRIKEYLGNDAYGAVQFGFRDLETTVVINDGETVVMGGMIRSKKTSKYAKVPLLGDIPWLGRLFRRESLSDENRNLLIFTTVHLLNPRGERLR